MQELHVDVAIIGAGTAGLSAYRSVKRAGKTAVIIEDGPYGTTCARVGCMPSKLLIAAADAAHHAQTMNEFGVHISIPVQVMGKQVMQRVRDERDRFVGFVLDDVEKISSNDRLRGTASFIDDYHLNVGGHTRVEANSVVIATGSSAIVPKELVPLGDRAIINDDVFNWLDLPKSVIVLGAGVIGLELGQALSRLGVEVTIVNRSESLAGISDPEVKGSARQTFEQELTMHFSTTVESATLLEDGVEVTLKDAEGASFSVRAEKVLCAAGRQPNIAALALENTSAVLDERGQPEFNKKTLQIKTDATDTALFFAGDVNAVAPILHEAADDGRISGSNAARWPEQTPQVHERRAAMGIVFTDPQIMMAGKRFKQLPEKVLIGEVDFSNQGRSRIMLKNKGKLRVYADPDTEIFLGAEMAGPAAEHIAHLLAWCVQQQLTISQMLSMPFYHPVIEEGVRTALRGARKPKP